MHRAGDICSAKIRAEAFANGCTALVHLATVPGGVAESDPTASRRVSIDAIYDLIEEAKQAGKKQRVVYASSIAVLGDPLPTLGVNDLTPLAPKMIYGGQMGMKELTVAMMHHRDEIEGISLRLPGILARPKGPSGMKSALMSDLFHDLRDDNPFICPVSAAGADWMQSVTRCVENFAHALEMDISLMPVTRVATLPALRITMGALAAEIAKQCGTSADLVQHVPDAALEAAFCTKPTLATPAANYAGFEHDGDSLKMHWRLSQRMRNSS